MRAVIAVAVFAAAAQAAALPADLSAGSGANSADCTGIGSIDPNLCGGGASGSPGTPGNTGNPGAGGAGAGGAGAGGAGAGGAGAGHTGGGAGGAGAGHTGGGAGAGGAGAGGAGAGGAGAGGAGAGGAGAGGAGAGGAGAGGAGAGGAGAGGAGAGGAGAGGAGAGGAGAGGAGGAGAGAGGVGGGDSGHHNGNGDYTHTYTPYVPPQGYSPPAQYPSGSDLDHCPPSYNGPWGGSGSTGTQYPYPPSYPSSYGQPTNTGSSYSGGNAPSNYEVSSPSYGESVTCGKPYNWKWSGPTGSKVKLELVYGQGESDCHTYTTISDSCDNSGSYSWTPYSNIPPTGGSFGYGLRVTCLDTGKQFYSNQFCFENNDFYNNYHHEACPTAKPTPITITCESPIPSPSPCETAAPAATPCETEAPAAATTPCETSAPAAPAAPQEAANATTEAAPPAYTGAASGIKASFTFVSALAVLVAFAL